LLGVFGDSSITGKPVGDDLREGKLTPLVAAAAARVSGPSASLLDRLGAPDLTPDDIRALQTLLVDCGAVAEVEAAIDQLVDEALSALQMLPLEERASRELRELGVYVAWRDR
jgi:geranylgeranyl diphosphate synthase type I